VHIKLYNSTNQDSIKLTLGDISEEQLIMPFMTAQVAKMSYILVQNVGGVETVLDQGSLSPYGFYLTHFVIDENILHWYLNGSLWKELSVAPATYDKVEFSSDSLAFVDEMLFLPYLVDSEDIAGWYGANKAFIDQGEINYYSSRVRQLADSYTLNIEGDGVVTGFKSALGEDGVSDFVIQADKFRVVGTKNGQPFGEGKSVFEVDTDDEKIYLNSNVVLRGNIVQTPDGEEYPIPVFRGKYNETYTYHKYDQVSHDGAVWIFMSDTPKTGEEPVIGSPYWDIYVEKGDKGTDAPLIKLSGATQVIKVSATGEVTPSANFTVIGTPINTTITTFQYSTNGASFTTTPPTGVTRSGNTVTVNPNTSTFITLTIRASDGTVSDSFTIARVGDGVKGEDGADGTDGVNGVDGVWGILSNHAHTVPSSSTGEVSNYTGSGTTIQVFEGSTALTFHTTIANSRFTVGTPTVSPASAITVGARSGSGTTTCTVADHSAMNNAQDMVQITYPITARRANGTSVTFNLVQTITKSKAGEKGEKGDQGEQGPGLIFRGNWQENETYYRTADRRDAVKYGNNYYLCNINNTTGVLPTNSTYWTQMNYFANIATGLMLAEDATINRYLTLSEGGVMRTEDGSVTFESDGIRMKPPGYPQRSMHLDGAQLAFWDKDGFPTVAIGDLTAAIEMIMSNSELRERFPEAWTSGDGEEEEEGERFPKSGFLMMAGNIALANSVLANSLVEIPGDLIGDGTLGRRKIAEKAIGIAQLDTENLYVPGVSNINIPRSDVYHGSADPSGNWTTIVSFSIPKIEGNYVPDVFRISADYSLIGDDETHLRIRVNGSVIAETRAAQATFPGSSGTFQGIIAAAHLEDTITVDVQVMGSYGGDNLINVSNVRIFQNDQLPIRAGSPIYVGPFETPPPGCQLTCQISCQGSCQVSCQDGCEGSCQTGCQTSCQATCEKTSQSGGGCIRQGTPVEVWDLEAQEYITVPVEDLKPGMILPWYQPETDTVIHGELTQLVDASYSHEFLRIRTHNGPSVDVTFSQPFDVLADLGQGQKWYKLQAMYLRPGMQLIRPFEAPDNRLSTIVSIETVREHGVHFWNPKTTTGGYCVNGYADMLIK